MPRKLGVYSSTGTCAPTWPALPVRRPCRAGRLYRCDNPLTECADALALKNEYAKRPYPREDAHLGAIQRQARRASAFSAKLSPLEQYDCELQRNLRGCGYVRVGRLRGKQMAIFCPEVQFGQRAFADGHQKSATSSNCASRILRREASS